MLIGPVGSFSLNQKTLKLGKFTLGPFLGHIQELIILFNSYLDLSENLLIDDMFLVRNVPLVSALFSLTLLYPALIYCLKSN